jgi:O-antigen ligase
MNDVQRKDSWPHTRRPLPWLFAGFLASIFIVPIDAVHMKVSLPFSSDYGRFFVALIVVVWLAGVVLNKRPSPWIRLRPRGWALGMIVFFAVVIISVILNISRITNLGELSVAEKRIALLVAMFAAFAIFAVSLRVTELRSFSVLIIVLATITSLGTIYEQKTGDNLFYSTASKVLSPIAEVEPAPEEDEPGRPMIAGPTRHALSVASLLGMAAPFAVAFAAFAPDARRRLMWGLLACIIIAGALVTQRRSGLVVPAAAIIAIFAIRPRKLARLIPFALIAAVLGLAFSGGHISAISQLTGNGDQSSTDGRTSDYAAVVPDIITHPAIGRGYGTLDTLRLDTYRIFDNQYLGLLYQVGLIGLLAWLFFVLTPVFQGWHAARSDNPLRGPPALAAIAGIFAFLVATALYDILTFPQAPYLFCFLAAMCTTAASVERVAPAIAVKRSVKRVLRPRAESVPIAG